MKYHRPTKSHKRIWLLLLLFVFVSAFLIKCIVQIRQSLFFSHKERINVLIYGQTPKVVSIGVADGQHYVVTFPADYVTQTPGCYGNYRIGALGKLSYLEKKPEILQRTFSHMLGSYIDYYYYPKKGIDSVYYGSSEEGALSLTIANILSYHTNASLIDSVYVTVKVMGLTPRMFKKLELITHEKSGKREIDTEAMARAYQGYFFENAYRKERASVQILYRYRYETALSLSQVLQGEGIRVVDMSITEPDLSTCMLRTKKSTQSKTVMDLSQMLGCSVESGNTDIYDIILILGDKERTWEICENP